MTCATPTARSSFRTTPSCLWVAAENARAHSFYKRNGYAADGHEQDQEVLGEELHEVRLVRPRSLARRLSLVTAE